MKFCLQCGTQIPAEAKFCPSCGTAQQSANMSPPETVEQPITRPTLQPGVSMQANPQAQVPIPPAAGNQVPPQPNVGTQIPPQPNVGMSGQRVPAQQAPMFAPSGAPNAAVGSSMAAGVTVPSKLAPFVPTKAQILEDLKMAGFVLAGAFGLSLFIAILLNAASPVHLGFGVVLAAAAAFVSMGHAGGIGGSVKASFFEVNASASFTCITLLAGIVVALYLLFRRSERVVPATSLKNTVGRIVSTALAYAAVLSVVTAILGHLKLDSQLGSLLGDSILEGDLLSVGASLNVMSGRLFLTGFLICALVGLAARWRTICSNANERWQARLAIVETAWGTVLRCLLAAAICAGVALAAWIIYSLIASGLPFGSQGGDLPDLGDIFPGGSQILATLILGVLLLGNVIVTLVLVVLGLPFVSGVDAESSFGLFHMSEQSPAFALIPVIVWLVIAAICLKRGLKSDRRIKAGVWFGNYIALFLAVLLGAAALNAISLNIPTLPDMPSDVPSNMHVGFSISVAFLIALVVGGLAACGHVLLLPIVAGSLPQFTTRIGGQSMHPIWALSLADAHVRRGLTPPSWMMEAADTVADQPVKELKDHRKALKVSALILGFLALLAVALVVVSIIFAATYSPKSVAKKYADAVARGDTKAAVDYLNLDGVNLIDNDAMKKAAESAQLKIEDVSGYGDNNSYEAVIKYSNATEQDEITVQLYKDGSKIFGLAPRWVIGDGGLGSLQVGYESDSDSPLPLKVNGVEVQPGNYSALPGEYVLESDENALYQSYSETQYLAWGGYSEFDNSLSLADGANEKVLEAVNKKVDECLAQNEMEPKGCPFSYYYYGSDKPKNIQWVRDGKPDIELYEMNNPFQVEFNYQTYSEISYDRRNSDKRGSDTVGIYFYGTATVNASGEIEIEYQD